MDYFQFFTKKKEVNNLIENIKKQAGTRNIYSVYGGIDKEIFLVAGGSGEYGLFKIGDSSLIPIEPNIRIDNLAVASVMDMHVDSGSLFLVGGAVDGGHKVGYLYMRSLATKRVRTLVGGYDQYFYKVAREDNYVSVMEKNISDGQSVYAIYQENSDHALHLIGEMRSGRAAGLASSTGHICGDNFYKVEGDPKDRFGTIKLALFKVVNGALTEVEKFVLKSHTLAVFGASKALIHNSKLVLLLNVIEVDEKTRGKREGVMSVNLNDDFKCL